MSYHVIISPIAEKQLHSLDSKTRARILLKLKVVRENPFLYVERLASQSLYKLRVGKYRIIMQILRDKCLVTILKVKKRSRAYD